MGEESVVTVALLHAAGLDHRMWRPVELELQRRGYRTRALDLPGHGDRPAPPADFTLEDLADDVVSQLIGSQPPAEASTLVLAGVSLGGMVAQHVALRPGGPAVSGLVLANTMAQVPAPLRDALFERAARTQRLGMAGVLSETLGRWFDEQVQHSSQPLMRQVSDWLLQADPDVNAQTWRAIADLSLLPHLPQVTAPTLVISGAGDRATPTALAIQLSQALPRSQHIEFAGAGHLTPLEEPMRFAAELDSFAAQVAGTAPTEDRA